MFQSMTGFGKASAVFKNERVEVEVRTLNSKGLDINLHLPLIYRELDVEIRRIAGDILQRGKIDILVNATSIKGGQKLHLNRELAWQYFKQIQDLAKTINEHNSSYLPLMLQLPGLFQSREIASADEKIEVMSLAAKAMKMVTSFRVKEGKSLKKDIESHLNMIVKKEMAIDSLDPQRIERIRQKLQSRFKELQDSEMTDSVRFEQELIYYMEKLDINEEKTRLRIHCNHLLETMKEANPGRKLGFIAQEIGREINTIGSKANDAGVQRLVVEMKDELEKIKEQVLNVL